MTIVTDSSVDDTRPRPSREVAWELDLDRTRDFLVANMAQHNLEALLLERVGKPAMGRRIKLALSLCLYSWSFACWLGVDVLAAGAAYGSEGIVEAIVARWSPTNAERDRFVSRWIVSDRLKGGLSIKG